VPCCFETSVRARTTYSLEYQKCRDLCRDLNRGWECLRVSRYRGFSVAARLVMSTWRLGHSRSTESINASAKRGTSVLS